MANGMKIIQPNETPAELIARDILSCVYEALRSSVRNCQRIVWTDVAVKTAKVTA